MRSPVRRVLAVDPGSRCIRFLLVERDFGRLRIVRSESIDLKGEGLVSSDELKAHVQGTLASLDEPAVALVLPQHLSTSQIVDLPLVQETEVQKLVEEESVKLSGVSDSRIVYDFVRAGPAVRNRQRYWVTLCQERNVAIQTIKSITKAPWGDRPHTAARPILRGQCRSPPPPPPTAPSCSRSSSPPSA